LTVIFFGTGFWKFFRIEFWLSIFRASLNLKNYANCS
jgi:hypothetical protein